MKNFVNEIYNFALRSEMETGMRPVRIEFPNPEHCVKINGVEIWCNSSLAGRLWLYFHPTALPKATTDDEACL